ncbi:adenylate cyclase type 7 isoform X1, partial [Tachysurus ichikawai]
ILSNAVVFACGIAVGAFHKVLMEKALRQTFQDTLRCLSVRMKLEIEKRQQVEPSLMYVNELMLDLLSKTL